MPHSQIRILSVQSVRQAADRTPKSLALPHWRFLLPLEYTRSRGLAFLFITVEFKLEWRAVYRKIWRIFGEQIFEQIYMGRTSRLFVCFASDGE